MKTLDKVLLGRGVARPSMRRRVITPWSPEFCTGNTLAMCRGTVAASTASSINDPIALPFRLSEAFTVSKLGVRNGSAISGNFDVGIYDPAWARLVSLGTTARSGSASAWQVVDVTDLTLGPGKYFLVYVTDTIAASTTAISNGWTGDIPFTAMHGIFDSATDALPLPNPLTNMALATVWAKIPMVGIVGAGGVQF